MSTLYVRDVSDEVTRVLKERAEAEGTSLSGYVASELTKLVARPTHAEVVARIRARDRSAGPETRDILAEVGVGRR